MGVSKNSVTPKSSILIGFSIINHPIWDTPILEKTNIRTMPCQIFGQHTSGPGMVSEPMDEHVSYENFFPQMVKFTKDFLGKVPNQMGLLANFLKNDFVSVEFRDFLWGGGVWIHLLAKNCPCGRNGMLQVKWFSVTTYGMSKKKGPYFSTLLGTDPRDDCPLPEQGSGLAPLEGDLQVASPPGAKHDSG